MIELTSPSRLHFGLFSFGDPSSPYQFGGVGCLIEQPRIHVQAEPSERFSAAGMHSDRVQAFAQKLCEHFGWQALPKWNLKVASAPRQHTGLGVGTQLAMSVGQVLCACRGEKRTLAEIAVATRRGKRSSIGVLGHDQGGLIVDSGRAAAGSLGQAEQHVRLPAPWRFVLAIDRQAAGLALGPEQSAFDDSPPVPERVTQRLREIALFQMVPAAQQADFASFAQSLYDYNVLAGNCFAEVQGGPFSSPAIAARVARIRELGFAGCGQSSWGPTVFALAKSETSAQQLVQQLQHTAEMKDSELIVTRPANQGAELHREGDCQHKQAFLS